MQISDELARELISVANEMADAARPEALRHFRRTDLATQDKNEGGRFDPVTEADRAAEAAMRHVLARRRPEDGIIGEEHGDAPGTSGLDWVLDPIDGTRGYISGTPTWGMLIGLCDARGVRLGLIDQPYIGERFIGGLGLAELRGPMGITPLRARPARPLSDATIFTTFPEIGSAEEARAFHHVAAAARLTRYGTDCYGYALIALGQVDLVIEAGLHSYDICGPIGVIEAAGGIVTDWQGGPAHHGGRIIAAANAQIHAAALERLAEQL